MHEHGFTSRLTFANMLEIDYHAVSNWLDAKNLPRFPSLLALSDFFKVSIDFLLGLTEDDRISRSSKKVSFSTRLNALMTENHITKYALAKKINVGQPTVSRWFLNETIPETTTLIKLSEYFGVSVEYLLGFCD